MLCPTAFTSPSWITASSSTITEIQCRTALYTTTIKSVRNFSPPCVVLRVALNWGPWYPFCRVNTSWRAHKSARTTRIFGPTQYPSKVFNSRPQYKLSYAFLRSRNTKNSRSWYTLSSSCASFSSMMAVLVLPPARNPLRKSWNVTAFLIHVSIMDPTTFQRTSKSSIPWVSALPLGIRINIFHHRSAGIVPCSHMNWTSYTSFIHFSGLGGGGVAFFTGYVSLRHILKW